MKETVLSIEHLSHQYEGSLSLENVSLKVFQGEFIGIFGPNGGGKTTLLKLILGLLKLQQGILSLFGKPPAQTRHLVGYVPQSTRLDKHFPISVLEVVMMGALQKLDWMGRYPSAVKAQALAALEQLNLGHKAGAAFGTLSGGEAQRALIARAIIDSPRLLILDEPTSNIDPRGEENVLEKLRELNKTMTILMVTHDLQTIVDKVDRLLCVQKQVTSLKAKEVCEHFALGLYHTPLTSQPHFPLS